MSALVERFDHATRDFEASALRARVALEAIEDRIRWYRSWVDRVAPAPAAELAPAAGGCPVCGRTVELIDADQAAVVIRHAGSARDCRIPIMGSAA